MKKTKQKGVLFMKHHVQQRLQLKLSQNKFSVTDYYADVGHHLVEWRLINL